MRFLAFVICYSLFVISPASAQERGPTPTTPEQIRAAIDKLGDLDYPTRMAAGRTIRRAPTAPAVTALLQAVSEHADGYVRFRALTLLTGYNDPRTNDAMLAAMVSPNDRLREVAYGYFEMNPNPALAPRMLAALEKEEGEFVRPALVRANQRDSPETVAVNQASRVAASASYHSCTSTTSGFRSRVQSESERSQS